MLAQDRSAHCVHKTFKADVEVRRRKGPYPSVVHVSSTVYMETTEEIARHWGALLCSTTPELSVSRRLDISFMVRPTTTPSRGAFRRGEYRVGGVIRDHGCVGRPSPRPTCSVSGPGHVRRCVAPGHPASRLIARGVVRASGFMATRWGFRPSMARCTSHSGIGESACVQRLRGLAPEADHRFAHSAPASG